MKHLGALSLALLSLSIGLLPGCPTMRRGGRTTSGGGGGGMCGGDFGTSHAAAKLESFFAATAEFHAAAMAAQSDLLAACQRTGRALGMSEADLSGSGDAGVRTVCGNVEGELRTAMASLRSSYTVNVDSRPPHCEVSVDAYAGCMAECEAQVDPGSVDITCEGGEIRGTCDAECTGRCAASVEGSCSGTCEGSCSGTCSARNADGSCAGTCDGTCHGECVVDAQASCSGECRGGCSVEYREPYCTGTLRRPTASARCRASCDARIEASARCTPGETNISIDGGMDAASQARYAQVQAAIREGVSAILAIRTRVRRLSTAGAEIIRTAPEIPEAAATVSIGAVACATAAAATCAEAAASVSVSVEVSVSVSASASIE